MNTKYSASRGYKVVAVIAACFSKDDQQAMIKKVAEKCKEHRCRVVFFSTLSDFYLNEQSDITEKKIFQMVSIEKFDAIVLMPETFKEEEEQKRLVRRATAVGVPVIAVDKHIDGCINISFDYEDAFRAIVKHMVEYHGYRRINFMAGIPNNRFSDIRLKIFKQVLLENNITFDPRRIYYGYFWEIPTVEAMKRMLEDEEELPEAIVCANDTMALTVCDFLRKRGYRVPDDVAVSGFDGIEAERYHNPRLLTSEYDINAFVDGLFQIINSDNLSFGEQEVEISAYGNMQIGGSCGCPEIGGIDAAAKIISLKSDMHEQMEYQMKLGRMVANYGNGDGMEIIQKVIPKQLRKMQYFDFWFCSEDRVLIADYPTYARNDTSGEIQVNDYLPEKVNALHYRKEEESETVEYLEKFPREELVPEIYTLLESDSPLLVVAVPTIDDETGYAVIRFQPERFWYTAYASFIFHFRFLLEMQKSKRRLMKLYNTDSLTGLLNRSGFYEKMEQIVKFCDAGQVTVISLDMYQFKQINDTFGHAEGDEALRKVGEIIRNSISNRDIAVRIGGDEFLIVLFREEQEEHTKEILTSIRRSAEEFNRQNEKGYKLIFSIGVCTENIAQHSLDYFLREADRKMYEHKSRQRNGEE